LTGQTDELDFTKTYTAGAAYRSASTTGEFNITRTITGGANTVNGSVLNVQDTGTGSAVSSAVLFLNQNNASAAGYLIEAQKAGSDVFNVTNAGSITLAASQSITGAGNLTIDAGSSSTLNLGTTNATSIVIGGNTSGTITEKVANSSSTAFQLQTAGATSILTADTSATNFKISIGTGATGQTNPTLFVLDSKTGAGDPSTTIAGSMYYNASSARFRCYENGAWADCLGFRHLIVAGSDSTSTASISCQNVTGLSFAVTSGVTYRFHATLIHTGSANTIGVGYGMSAPAAPTLAATSFGSTLSTGIGSGGGNNGVGACGTPTASSANVAGTADTVDGILIPSANGTYQLQFEPETATAGGVVIKAGSTLEWW